MAAKGEPLRATWREKGKNSHMRHRLHQGERRIHEKTELKKNYREKKSKKEGIVRDAKITSSP